MVRFRAVPLRTTVGASLIARPALFRRYQPQFENFQRQISSKTGQPDVLTDTFGRRHDYLRISVTERCNLRCVYCMPEEGVALSPPESNLTTPEIVRLAELFVAEGVTKIRLTGGEPTVRRDIVPLLDQLGSLSRLGLRQLCMTSNGIALERKLDRIAAAGLTGLNISLDTLDPHLFTIMTRRNGLEAVQRCISRVIAMNRAGANIELKINVVVMRGVNESEIVQFVELARHDKVEIRFIEYMPFDGNRWGARKMVSFVEMVDLIKSTHPGLSRCTDPANATSKTYRIPGFAGRIGFITSMTHNFCSSCNRLRITSDGNLKACLFDSREVSLRDVIRKANQGRPITQPDFFLPIGTPEPADRCERNGQANAETQTKIEDELRTVIRSAVTGKKAGHASAADLAAGTNRPMILIGGYVARTGGADVRPLTRSAGDFRSLSVGAVPPAMLPRAARSVLYRPFSAHPYSTFSGPEIGRSISSATSNPVEASLPQVTDGVSPSTDSSSSRILDCADADSIVKTIESAITAGETLITACDRQARELYRLRFAQIRMAEIDKRNQQRGFKRLDMSPDEMQWATSYWDSDTLDRTDAESENPDQADPPTVQFSDLDRAEINRQKMRERRRLRRLRDRQIVNQAQDSQSTLDANQLSDEAPFVPPRPTSLPGGHPLPPEPALKPRPPTAFFSNRSADDATSTSSRSEPTRTPITDPAAAASPFDKNTEEFSLPHIDPRTMAPRMIDVSQKASSVRIGYATGRVIFSSPKTYAALLSHYDPTTGSVQARLRKGDPLSVAHIAGINGAKMLPMLVPLCHPLSLTGISLEVSIIRPQSATRVNPGSEPDSTFTRYFNRVASLEPEEGAPYGGISIAARVSTRGPTGVEMEALAAVSTAGLAVVDMLKAVDREMVLDQMRVVGKQGGWRGSWWANGFHRLPDDNGLG